MPTYSKVTVDAATSNSTAGGLYETTSKPFTRTPDGVLWEAQFDSTRRYVQIRSSDDDGATWSAATNVHDYGGAGHNEEFWLLCGLDGEPKLFAYDQGTAGAPFRLYSIDRTAETPAWGPVCDPAPTGGDLAMLYVTACPVVQTSNGHWYFFTVTGTEFVTVQLNFIKSTDNGATWQAGVLVRMMYTGAVGIARLGRSGLVAIAGPDDVIHVIACDLNNASTRQAVLHIYGDASAGSPSSWTTEVVNDPNFSTGSIDHRIRPDIAVGPDGTLHAVWLGNITSGAATGYLQYSQKPVGGSWSARVLPGPTVVETAPPVRVWVAADNIPRILIGTRGLGTATTGYFPTVFTAGQAAGTSWTAQKFEDSGAGIYCAVIGGIANEHTLGLEHTRLVAGFAGIITRLADSDVEYWYSDDLVWGGAAAIEVPPRPRFPAEAIQPVVLPSIIAFGRARLRRFWR